MTGLLAEHGLKWTQTSAAQWSLEFTGLLAETRACSSDSYAQSAHVKGSLIDVYCWTLTELCSHLQDYVQDHCIRQRVLCVSHLGGCAGMGTLEVGTGGTVPHCNAQHISIPRCF